VVFYRKRAFTLAQFQRFMFVQSKPYPEMIGLFAQLKVRCGLKITVVSNEARELNAYGIRKFKLDDFVDASISSCFVYPQARRGHLSACARRRSDAGSSGTVHRKHADGRADRGRLGNSKHPSHRLQIHLREIGVLRIAE